LGRVRSELFAYATSLIQGRGFGTCDLVISLPSKIPQTTNEDGAIRLSYNVTERTSLIVKEEMCIDEPRIKKTIELMSKLRDALRNPSTSKRAEDLLRVIRWWAFGDLDTDPVDRFLKFFIAFEGSGTCGLSVTPTVITQALAQAHHQTLALATLVGTVLAQEHSNLTLVTTYA
jgi:hypothetical protein